MYQKLFMIQKFFYLILLFFLGLQLQGEMKIVTNPLEEIDAVEGKIKLTLVYVWGEDDTEDINQVFLFPDYIKIDSTGCIYIVDSGNNRIQVFDKSRKFIRTISQKGKGPGDMLGPHQMAFLSNNNIVISDTHNYRIQILGPQGKYIHSFPTGPVYQSQVSVTSKDDIVLYLPKKNDMSYWMLSLYDLKGNLTKELFRLPSYESESTFYTTKGKKNTREYSREYISYLFDEKDNIFISYTRVPVFLKFSNKGKLLMALSFGTPLETPSYHLSPETGLPEIKGGKSPAKSIGFTVDRQGRIFMAAVTRLPIEKERSYIVGGPGSMERWPKEVPEETDKYRLFVFNDAGKIIAAKSLSVFCNHIYVKDDRLFIVDAFMGMKIYEYKFKL